MSVSGESPSSTRIGIVALELLLRNEIVDDVHFIITQQITTILVKRQSCANGSVVVSPSLRSEKPLRAEKNDRCFRLQAI